MAPSLRSVAARAHARAGARDRHRAHTTAEKPPHGLAGAFKGGASHLEGFTDRLVASDLDLPMRQHAVNAMGALSACCLQTPILAARSTHCSWGWVGRSFLALGWGSQ